MKKNISSTPEAVLWEKKDNNSVQCNICNIHCIIPPGKIARCFARKNVDGKMKLNNYGYVSSMAVDPIEKKPLYHFYPGTKVFSTGGWGCNFKCLHCQNWSISQDIKEDESYFLPPDKLVELAKKHNARGISWTYNEPSIHLEYTIESAKLAKEQGFYTAYITNGYMSEDALDLIAPYLDAFRVDLKSFDDKFYREICNVKDASGVFKTTLHAKKLGMHIEAVTNIIPTKNDSEETLRNIAKWIVKNLGKDTPWHVTKFFPCYKLMNIESTPVEILKRAEEIGIEEGLKFIYLGNVLEKSNTICPKCGKTIVWRSDRVITDINSDGTCKQCGENLNIITS